MLIKGYTQGSEDEGIHLRLTPNGDDSHPDHSNVERLRILVQHGYSALDYAKYLRVVADDLERGSGESIRRNDDI